jgi:hypothetical protein
VGKEVEMEPHGAEARSRRKKEIFFAGGGVFTDSPFNGWLLFFFEAQA